MHQQFGLRYRAINRRGEIVERVREFPTDRAREQWIAKQESRAEDETGGFLGVVAFSDPRPSEVAL